MCVCGGGGGGGGGGYKKNNIINLPFAELAKGVVKIKFSFFVNCKRHDCHVIGRALGTVTMD